MMRKIKIIDLIKLIAAGKEAPKKVIYKSSVYSYNGSNCDLQKYHGKQYPLMWVIDSLNDDVEIIEEAPSIEKYEEIKEDLKKY